MKKRFLSLLAVAAVLCAMLAIPVSAAAEGTCGEALTWVLDDGGTLTITGTGPMTDYNYSYDAPWHALRASVKKVVLEPGVTSIGGNAFHDYDSLTSVSIPDSVTCIGEYAFGSCGNLTGSCIGNNVTTIGKSAYYDCTSITEMTIPDTVITMGDGVFDGCTGLTSLTIPDGVTSLGKLVFCECTGLTSVIVGSGVTSIGDFAFDGCTALTSVTLGRSVSSFGMAIFYNCPNLKDVYYDGTAEDWRRISTNHSNDDWGEATIHFMQDMLAAESAVLSPQKLTVDGKTVDCEKYNIGGSNYFKLRDIAWLLNGTGSQFAVGWDAASSTVSITTGQAYLPNGSELAVGEDKSSTTVPSSQTIMIDGMIRKDLSVFNIGGNNFFKLRDLGQALGFSVDYDAGTNTAVVISAEPEPVPVPEPEPQPEPEPEPGPTETTYLSFPESVIMTENGGTDLSLSYDGEPQGLVFTTDSDCIELQLMPDEPRVYLWARHPGVATVTATDSRGNRATCQVTVLKTYGLIEAVEAGLLSVDIRCDGMESADLTITNTSDTSVSFRIEAGTYFVSANRQYQDMLVLSNLSRTLSPGMSDGPRSIRVRCMNLHRDMPAAGVRYSLSRTTNEKLRALTEKLCWSSKKNAVEQAAVWILTDNATYEDCSVLVYEDGSQAISKSDYETAKELIDSLP